MKTKTTSEVNGTSFDAMKQGFSGTNQAAMEAQTEPTNKTGVAKRLTKRATKAATGSAKLKAPKPRRVYESGISQNVSHGEQVVNILTTWGTSYIPSKPDLLPANLEILNTEAWQHINTVQEDKQARKGDITLRQNAYNKLGSLARRVLNELAASGAPKNVVEDAKHYVEKIEGQRIIKIKASETDENHISACQTSFVEQVGHLNGLIGVVKPCPEYNPNVLDLKVTALEARRDAMMDSNSAFYKTNAQYGTDLKARNEFFNADYKGYVEIYGAVKRAVKAIYGNSSDQYKQISGFAFKKIR